MASEYLKWKYRNERPEEKRELTPREKRRNWWHYHWKHVAAGIAATALLGRFAYDRLTRVEPDCSVALVTRCQVSGVDAASLRSALEAVCPDANGDGRVLVNVNVIRIDYTSTDQSPEALKVMEANVDKLNFDFYTRQSGIFLLDDPARFQESHQALRYLDGTNPPEGASDWERMVRPWTSWPGSGQVELESCRDTPLWFGRRVLLEEGDRETFAGAEALWAALFPGEE